MAPPKKPVRTRLDPEKRRAQLLDCAVGAFADHGIARATHSHVAERAGMSVSAVYSYFRTRDDLRDATLYEVERFLDEMVARELSGARDPYEELIALARAFADAAEETPDLMKVWLDWSTGIESPAWPAYLDVLGRIHEATQATIARAQKAGDAAGDLDTLTAARLYNGGGHTIALMKFAGASGADLDRFVERLARSALGLSA